MNGLLGHIGVLLALLAAVGGLGSVLGGLYGRGPRWLAQAPYFAGLCLGGLILAVVAMEHALLTHDFSLAFVAANNARETPLLFDITGLWSALQGSILLWTVVLAIYVVIIAVRFRTRLTDPVVGIALAVMFAITTYFLALMLGPSDPFAATVGAIPSDGAGVNSLLQENLLVAIHPPFLYLGYVGFTVPFAFAISALITGRVGERWLADTRRFAILAWAFLTVGIILGAWWSYQALGWGGFWGWDPVENAALLPWLTATAYLHSAMVQERRGLLRIWNLSLLIATYSLTILGTYFTRSGLFVDTSVHAFSNSGLGTVLLVFFSVIVVSGVGLIGWRGDRLRSPGSIDSPVSREGAFLVNNLLFAAFAAVVLLGTVFPLFVNAFSGQEISIGRPYFDTFTAPLGVGLLFFMAVAPALPWRKAGRGVLARRLVVPAWIAVAVLLACVLGGVRGLLPLAAFTLGAFAAAAALRQLVLAGATAHRHGLGVWRGLVGRANGGMVVHLGIVIIAVALTAATSYSQATAISLHPGETARFDHHTIELLALRPVRTSNESGDEAVVRIDGRTVLRPEILTFAGERQGSGVPSISSTLVDDLYLAPSGRGFTLATKSARATATFDVIVQPLVIWLWIGGGVVAFGSLLALVPGRRRRPTDPSSVPLPELAEIDLSGAGATR
jgi:cytochrome c-type biogenesis protein CcmF